MPKQTFLVARRNERGAYQRVSSSGYVLDGAGACHPLAEGMSEAAHEAICRAAQWMFGESLRPSTVDLTMDGDWRISPIC